MKKTNEEILNSLVGEIAAASKGRIWYSDAIEAMSLAVQQRDEEIKEWIEIEDKKLEFGGIIRKNELI